MLNGKPGLLLKAGISAALLLVLLTRVPTADLGAALAGSQPGLLAAAVLAALAGWVVNTAKWQQLLAALGHRPPYAELLALNFVGMFYSLVLPGQISGEVLKGVRLARRGVSGGAVASSILMDRLTGLAALALLGLGGIALGRGTDSTAFAAWVALAVLALAAFPLVAARAQLPRPHAEVSGIKAKLWFAALAINDALVTYRARPLLLGGALGFAFVFQGFVSLSNYFAAQALGIDLPLASLVWIVAAVSLINLAPVSLGGLGVREGAYVFLLQQQGVPLAQGLALSLVVFGVLVVQGLAGGVVEAGWRQPAAAAQPPQS